jgi:hypothetical protein
MPQPGRTSVRPEAVDVADAVVAADVVVAVVTVAVTVVVTVVVEDAVDSIAATATRGIPREATPADHGAVVGRRHHAPP